MEYVDPTVSVDGYKVFLNWETYITFLFLSRQPCLGYVFYSCYDVFYN